MLMTFRHEQIKDWATLANDFNPIHFEEDAARHFGLDGIVVHGMLPLLHIKRKLSASFPIDTSEKWTTISCKFRQPVAEGLSHQLEINTCATGRRFSLRRDGDGKETISGMATTRTINAMVAPNFESFSIGEDIVREKKATFEQAFPEFEHAWLLLDSLTFSQFLTNEIPFQLIKASGGFKRATNQNDLMKHVLMVQTSHIVSIAPELRMQTIEEFDLNQTIHCNILPPVTVAGDNSLAGSCQINVSVGGHFVMQSEVGIFLRFSQFSTVK